MYCALCRSFPLTVEVWKKTKLRDCTSKAKLTTVDLVAVDLIAWIVGSASASATAWEELRLAAASHDLHALETPIRLLRRVPVQSVCEDRRPAAAIHDLHVQETPIRHLRRV